MERGWWRATGGGAWVTYVVDWGLENTTGKAARATAGYCVKTSLQIQQAARMPAQSAISPAINA
jgi:hypothetical protein